MVATTARVHGRGDILPTERRMTPVIWWAAVGFAFVVVQFYVYGRWALSSPERTPTGSSAMPGWMDVSVTVWQFASPALLVAAAWWFIVRPWRRNRRVGLDGLVMIGCLSGNWQDTFLNYFHHWFGYNTHLWNLGSWDAYIPGWLSPNGNQLAEPFIFVLPVYAWGVFGAIYLGAAVMRAAKRRWQNLGRFGLVAIGFVFLCVADIVLEGVVFMRLGLYHLGGSIENLTLFHGKYYQFPVYEAIYTSLWFTPVACLLYFKDDRGHSVVERGVADLRISERRRMTLRALAVVGACNVAMLVGYGFPAVWTSLYSSPWPADITNRSYFTNGLCGPGTTYSCGGPKIPLHKRGSVHVGPDGQFVVPPGMTLP